MRCAPGIFVPDANGLSELDSDSDEEDRQFSFPDLTAQIEAAIAKFGPVFPKLNWSSPQDAEWIISNPSLRCETAEDVYIVLSASDFVTHDLEHAYETCVDAEADVAESFELVLKPWRDMPRSQEFRCFVRDSQFVGGPSEVLCSVSDLRLAISQRDSNYYEFLTSAETRRKILSLVQPFFTEHVRNVFPSRNCAARSVCVLNWLDIAADTFDIYITRDFDRVFLIDFNPYALHTDALLFDWPTVQSLPADQPILRVVEDELQASQALPRFSHNRYPMDMIQIGEGKTIPEFAADWQAALAAQGE
jgi:hypothetical protein